MHGQSYPKFQYDIRTKEKITISAFQNTDNQSAENKTSSNNSYGPTLIPQLQRTFNHLFQQEKSNVWTPQLH